MMRSIGRTALLVGLLSSCHPAAPSPPTSPPTAPKTQPAPTCTVRFDAPTLPEPEPPAPLAVPPSEAVMAVSFDPSSLAHRLGQQVPPRVAAARNVDAGIAGKLSYHIDRSPFAVAVRERRLFVTTHLTARADLCKPLGPLGCVDYAHCSPAANATASIALSLGASYRLGPASVAIHLTRPCQVGGVDATPRIQRGADAQARRIQRRINAMLPSFAGDAQLLWRAMGVHVPLGLDSRLRITPHHVLEGPPRKEGSRITIPLGVRATVRIESRQGEHEDVGPIPPPRSEPDLSPGLRLHVPISLDLDAIDAGLSRTVRSVANGDDQRAQIMSVRSQPTARGLRLLVTIKGPACGVAAFHASPVFDETSGRIALSDVTPVPSEVSRVRAFDPTLNLYRIARTIEALGQVALTVDPFAIPKGLERSVELLDSDDGPDVRLEVGESVVERVLPTPTGVAALVNVQGEAEVVLR